MKNNINLSNYHINVMKAVKCYNAFIREYEYVKILNPNINLLDKTVTSEIIAFDIIPYRRVYDLNYWNNARRAMLQISKFTHLRCKALGFIQDLWDTAVSHIKTLEKPTYLDLTKVVIITSSVALFAMLMYNASNVDVLNSSTDNMVFYLVITFLLLVIALLSIITYRLQKDIMELEEKLDRLKKYLNPSS